MSRAAFIAAFMLLSPAPSRAQLTRVAPVRTNLGGGMGMAGASLQTGAGTGLSTQLPAPGSVGLGSVLPSVSRTDLSVRTPDARTSAMGAPQAIEASKPAAARGSSVSGLRMSVRSPLSRSIRTQAPALGKAPRARTGVMTRLTGMAGALGQMKTPEARQGRSVGLSGRLRSMWDGAFASRKDGTAVMARGTRMGAAGRAALSRAVPGVSRQAAPETPPPAAEPVQKPSRLGKFLKIGAAASVLGAGAILIGPALLTGMSAEITGLSLTSASMAFVAGILSFLSPCVLPLIPGYVSFVSGMSHDELTKTGSRREVVRNAGLGSLAFVAGFSFVFVGLGATATAVGGFLFDYLPIFTKVAGVAIAVVGLHTMGVLKIPILYRFLKVDVDSSKVAQKAGFMRRFIPFLMGLSFAFAWTPCVGPILAGVLGLASMQGTVMSGVVLLALYSLGLGIPFIATSLFINKFMSFFQKYKKHMPWVERIAGAMLILFGVLIFFDNLSLIMEWLPEFFHGFSV